MEQNTLERFYEAEESSLQYDLLAEAVAGRSIPDTEDSHSAVEEYLGSFLEARHLEVFERAKEGGHSSLNQTDQRLWTKVKYGIIRHPAIIGNVALLLGRESLEDMGEDGWISESGCKGDTRFVQATSLLRKNEVELKEICEDCPVFDACQEDSESKKLEKGFRAGTIYLDKG
jgi:hypothetical protein